MNKCIRNMSMKFQPYHCATMCNTLLYNWLSRTLDDFHMGYFFLVAAGMGGYPVTVEPGGLWERERPGGAAILRLAARTHAHERVSNPNVLNITTFYSDVSSIPDTTSELQRRFIPTSKYAYRFTYDDIWYRRQKYSWRNVRKRKTFHTMLQT